TTACSSGAGTQKPAGPSTSSIRRQGKNWKRTLSAAGSTTLCTTLQLSGSTRHAAHLSQTEERYTFTRGMNKDTTRWSPRCPPPHARRQHSMFQNSAEFSFPCHILKAKPEFWCTKCSRRPFPVLGELGMESLSAPQ